MAAYRLTDKPSAFKRLRDALRIDTIDCFGSEATRAVRLVEELKKECGGQGLQY
jgi:hypothetical protein